MADINGVLQAFAGIARDLHAQSQALDVLVRGLYFERAVERGLFPVEAEEEILSLVEGVASRAEGADTAATFQAGVQKALADFGRELRELLEASQHRPE